MPQILDGTRIRDQILNELKPRVAALAARGRAPGLAVVLAGHDPVRKSTSATRSRRAQEMGIHSEIVRRPIASPPKRCWPSSSGLNARAEIDGILVQLPVPKQVDAKRMLLALSPEKDVDGFHPFNVG